MKKSALLLVLIILSGVASAQLNGKYTIGTSSSADYTTINEAIDALHKNNILGPITFQIEPGTYNEQIYLDAIFGVSQMVYITFESKSGNGNDVIIRYTPTDSANYTIRLDYAYYLIFKNLTFMTDTVSGHVMEIVNSSNNIYFFHNRFIAPDSSTTDLIYTETSTTDNNSVVFRGNYFINGRKGLALYGDDQSYESNNEVSNNYFYGQTDTALFVQYQNAPIITGNQISTSGNGIILNNCSNNFDVSGNHIICKMPNNQAFGLRLYKSSGDFSLEGMVSNNMIHMNSSNPVTGFDETVCEFINIYHNSIHITGSTKSGTAIALTMGNNINMINNNVVNETGGLAITNATTGNFISHHNNLYSNGYYIGTWQSLHATDIATWQNISTQGTGSMSVQIDFCSDSNLHTYDSSLDNKGAPLADINQDIDGNTRDSYFPDIGASEFRSVMMTLGADTAICANDSFIITAPSGFDKYFWWDSASKQNHVINSETLEANVLYAWVQAYKGDCPLADTIKIEFYQTPNFDFGPDTTYCTDTSIRLSGGPGYFSYQWQDNSSDSFLVVSSDTVQKKIYWLEITTDKGCQNRDSIEITYINCINSIKQHFKDFRLYPNPTKGTFTIDLGNSYDKVRVSVFDISGKMVESRIFENSQILNLEIDQPEGIYVVKIESNDFLNLIRLFKQ